MPRYRVKPTKPASALTLVLVIGIGVYAAVGVMPKEPLFGALLMLAAVGVAIYHGANLASRQGVASHEITDDDES
jgi:hypothetical protein